MNTHLSEALDGVETMKGAAQEDTEIERFVTNARRVRTAFVRQGDLEARFVPMLLLGITYAAGLSIRSCCIRGRNFRRRLWWPTSVCCACWNSPPSLPRLPTARSRRLSGGHRILELINRETDLDQNVAGLMAR